MSRGQRARTLEEVATTLTVCPAILLGPWLALGIALAPNIGEHPPAWWALGILALLTTSLAGLGLAIAAQFRP